MRHALLGLLILLYAVGGLSLAIWTALYRGEPIGSPNALPLPEGFLWAGAAAAMLIAVGAWLRIRGTRWFAILVHLAIVVGAIAVYGLHVSGDRLMRGDSPLLETAAKAAVHALLLLYWFKSRAVKERFAKAK